MTTKFTTDHEWINIEDHDAAVVGITLHAQDALGDVVFVDLPAVGGVPEQPPRTRSGGRRRSRCPSRAPR